MTPGDPNQVDDEIIWYHFALIAAAILALVEELLAKNDNKTSEVEISAVDMHEFMLKKAKACPITQNVLNEMRFAEVLLLLHQAEETSDANKYVTALKFASLLITTTHATKYTYIHARFLIWWHCASEADKTIFEKIIMTKRTKSNKTDFTDRFVEWMVRDIRDVVRKHHRARMKRKLNRAAILLEEKQHFKETFRLDKDPHQIDDEEDGAEMRITHSKLGKVFCASLVYCDESSLWKSTDISRMTLDAEPPPINPETISVTVIGKARMDEYIRLHFKIDNLDDNEEDLIKDSRLLREIQSTQQKQGEDDRLDVKRSVSSTPSFVKDKYKLKELVVVYKHLKDNWDQDAMGSAFPAKGSSGNKDEYSYSICKARDVLKRKVPNWAETTKTGSKEKFNNGTRPPTKQLL